MLCRICVYSSIVKIASYVEFGLPSSIVKTESWSWIFYIFWQGAVRNVVDLRFIHNNLYNNSYSLLSHNTNTLNWNQSHNPPTNKHSWTTFTYVGKEPSRITNILKHSNIRIAYRTNNTLKNHLTHTHTHTHNTQNPDKISLSGVYKLTCSDCKNAYVGQRGWDFITRYNEHKRFFRNNSHTSKSVRNIVDVQTRIFIRYVMYEVWSKVPGCGWYVSWYLWRNIVLC